MSPWLPNRLHQSSRAALVDSRSLLRLLCWWRVLLVRLLTTPRVELLSISALTCWVLRKMLSMMLRVSPCTCTRRATLPAWQPAKKEPPRVWSHTSFGLKVKRRYSSNPICQEARASFWLIIHLTVNRWWPTEKSWTPGKCSNPNTWVITNLLSKHPMANTSLATMARPCRRTDQNSVHGSSSRFTPRTIWRLLVFPIPVTPTSPSKALHLARGWLSTLTTPSRATQTKFTPIQSGKDWASEKIWFKKPNEFDISWSNICICSICN